MNRFMLRKIGINKKMAAVIGISVLLLMFELIYGQGFWTYDYSKTATVTMLSNVYALSQYVLFAGMFPGSPYALTFLDESRSGYQKYILGRMSYKAYIFQKISGSLISGMMVTGIPYIIMAMIIRTGTMAATVNNINQDPEQWMWSSVIMIGGGIVVIAGKGVLCMLFGGMWSLLTMFVSMVVSNRYAAFILPFIIYQVIWLIFPIRQLNPVFLIRSDFDGSMKIGVPFFVFLVYIILLIFLILRLYRRKIRNAEL